MFISEAAARSIVREIKEITGRDINIMDENGVIFASTDPERVDSAIRGPAGSWSRGCPASLSRRTTPIPAGPAGASTSPSNWRSIRWG